MISVVGGWTGLQGIGLEELKKMNKPAERAVLKASLHYESAVKKILTGPRSGRIYELPGQRGRKGKKRKIRSRDHHGRFMTRGTYQASAPGEPPAFRLGDLRKSISHVITWTGDEVQGNVGSRIAYARILEFGGLTGRNHRTRILPRPYFSAVFLAEEQRLLAILEEATKS